jgi:DNA-binding NtrC family response regulator
VETSGHKILVVDDERTIADTLAVIFFQRGYNTRAAYSAEQALEIVAEWPPDLAILDVVLPKINGIDLSILLSERFPKCRTLLFSGQALTADLLAEAEKKGYTFAILAKPVHPSLLLEAAVKVLTADKENRTSNL